MIQMRNLFKRLFLLLPFICLVLIAQAQPGTPGPDPDPSVPIDGGLSLIVAAGIGYAVKKGVDNRKKQQAPPSGTENTME